MTKFTGERLVPINEACDNNTKIYKEHMIRYKFCLDFIENKKVLDISCGTGYGTKFLAQNNALEVWGGDVDEESIELAKKEYSGENVHFRVMDAEELPFDDNYFDTVTSLETIEHIKNYDVFFKEIKRVLKSGGKLILSTPNRKVVELLGINNPYHIKEFDKNELLDLFKDDFVDTCLFGQREFQQLTLGQRLLKKLYIAYEKISWLKFLKKIVPARGKKIISNGIEGLSGDYSIVKFEDEKEYMYFVITATRQLVG